MASRARTRERSIRGALKAQVKVARLYTRLGSADHPRTGIVKAYANAERALQAIYAEHENPTLRALAAEEVFWEFRQTVQGELRKIVEDAESLGRGLAIKDLKLFEEAEVDAGPIGSLTEDSLAELFIELDFQTQLTGQWIRSGRDLELVTHPTRGAFQRTAFVRKAVLAVGTVIAASQTQQLARGLFRREERYQKQVVATIDQDTTETCLIAHGQTQPLDRPFKLTGSPRYADELMNPPFHDHCRTTTVLVPVELVADDLTHRMEQAAEAERDIRVDLVNQIEETKRALADEGVEPSTTPKAGDSSKVSNLRTELRKLRVQFTQSRRPAGGLGPD